MYTDHQALQYLNIQGKLNQRHLKWVEFLQSYTFFLKHKSGKYNKVVDALSRRHLLLIEMQIEVIGFKELMNLYPEDPNFTEAWKAYIVPTNYIGKDEVIGFHNQRWYVVEM